MDEELNSHIPEAVGARRVVRRGGVMPGTVRAMGALACLAAIACWNAHAQAAPPRMPVVGGWGYNGFGQCQPPANLVNPTQVAGGSFHSAAIDSTGALWAWGRNADGQCNVDMVTEAASEVRCGGYFTAVRTLDGNVICFGNNDWYQLNVPEEAVNVVQIATGDAHVLARRQDGTVVAWGMNSLGQSDVPLGLATVTDVAAGAYHSLAVRQDGSMAAWGLNFYGECSVPAQVGPVQQSAGGLYHSLALRRDGTVRAWGLNDQGQCWVPNALLHVVQVAAGDYHSAALTDSGDVVMWGSNPIGQLAMPSRIAGVSSIASGTYHMACIFEGDCDANGRLDSADIAQGLVADLNENGQPDSCDLARGYEEDCDANGTIDSYQQQLNATAYASSGPIDRIGDGHPVQWAYDHPSLTLDDPVLVVHARGDFSSPSEWLQVSMNGRFVAKLFTAGSDKNDCRSAMTRYVVIPRDFFNQYIQVGDHNTLAVFEATASIAVNADQCPTGSFVWFEIAYTAASTGDCNANGLLDTCEIAAHPELDLNTDGVLDACQIGSFTSLCPGDLDMDRAVTGADLSLMLLNYGPCMPGDPSDLDGNGTVGNEDLSLLLLNFGSCN